MLQAVDSTSLYIPGTDPNLAAAMPGGMQQLAAQGVGMNVIGFDNAPASQIALSATLGAGMLWSGYRFLYWGLDVSQCQSAIDGIHQFTPDAAHLPNYLFFDAEENGNGVNAPANPAVYFHALRIYVESHDITPTSLVRPGIYTRLGWWNEYVPASYDELAAAGWVVWPAEEVSDPDHATPFGHWQRSQIVGVQNQWNVTTSLGLMDYSTFRDPVPAPPTPQPSPLSIVSLAATMSDASVRSLFP